MKQYHNPSKEQFHAIKDFPINTPLLMLNLLKFKNQVEDSKLSGEEQYKMYMKAAEPFIKKAGAELIYYGIPLLTVIGPDELEWNKVLIVKYPTKAAFMDMITTKNYPAHLRTKALEDSRLIMCK